MTPESTAEKATNSAPARLASRWASVVLPVPGGPQRISECSAFALDHLAQQPPGAEQVLLADELVERRGRMRSASGAVRAPLAVGRGGEKVGLARAVSFSTVPQLARLHSASASS